MDLILKGSHLPCHEADEEGLKAKNKVCQEPAFVLEGSQCSVEFQQWLLGDKTEKPSPDEEHEARPHDGILLSQEEELSSPQVGRPLPYHPLFWDLGQRSPLTASGLNLIINKMSIKKIPYSEILEME
ncbi:uncharacterized protein LOC105079804 isoform X7 [Camelus bactrianus]|uniref:Uncharacterized protein LOC105079804 isoform X7 n=1 Tax=Camelus bactrianus TaxID=9837 RepID=A0AC58QW50_CAMBA